LKKSFLAVLLLLAFGACAYWLQSSTLFQSYWAEAATTPAATDKAKAPPTKGGGSKRPPVPVELATSKSAEVSDDIFAIGTLLSDESADVSAETSGRIVAINFADGAAVTAGDVLFRLDDALAQAVLNDAKAKLGLAKTVQARTQALLKSRTIPQSQAEEAATALVLAESAVALAEVQLAKLTIRAPFTGRAGFRAVSHGAYVQAGAPLVHLEKIDLLKVAFSVPELQFTQLRVGQSVTVTADALTAQTFTASISAIDPLVDVSGRAVRVRASLENRDGLLRPGMLVRMNIRGGSRTTVTVPEAALVPRGNGSVVYTAEGEKVREVAVTTGKRRDGAVEILDGLAAGQSVVVAGNTRLSNGTTVAVVGTKTD